MLKINKVFTFCIIFVCVVFASCVQNKNKITVTDNPKSGTINISVDESFKPIMEEAIKAYEGTYIDAHIIAHYKPEAECFKDLYSDSNNRMIFVTRGLTHKESVYYSDSLGYTPISNRIAWDAITIVTNAYTTDTLFTLQCLQQLLEGKKSNNTKVVFDGLNKTSLVRFAIDSILHGANFDTSIVKAEKDSKAVLEYIANNKDAIGFVGISWIGNPEDAEQVNMLKKVKIAYVKCNVCENTPYVKPTQSSILNKRYPLVRGLYYILKENYSGLGSGFADFLNYERGQLIFKRGYLGPIMNFETREIEVN